MSDTFKILVLEGDGIGPEVMAEALKVIDWLNTHTDIQLEIEKGLLGGAAYDETGNPYPGQTQKLAKQADGILLAAIGGPEWAGVSFEKRPEQGLLDIREDLDLFANLRPSKVFPQLVAASSLKDELVEGLDILIVRELVGGIYFGGPRGIEDLGNGQKRGFNTTSYTTKEVKRIARVAFAAAQKRQHKVCSVDKANVLESSIVWREAVEDLSKDYTGVEFSHLYVDNAAMQLATRPKQFDVLLAPNLAGDVLSDLAAAITGSIGLLPSASVGEVNKNGRSQGLYEPVHGSAPDIAGQNKANPLATILSLAMLLETSCNRPDLASLLNHAVEAALQSGARTVDVARGAEKALSTQQMGDAVIQELNHQLTQKRDVS